MNAQQIMLEKIKKWSRHKFRNSGIVHPILPPLDELEAILTGNPNASPKKKETIDNNNMDVDKSS